MKDTTLFAINASNLKDLTLLRVKAESEALSLRLNVSKTKMVMVIYNIFFFTFDGTEAE